MTETDTPIYVNNKQIKNVESYIYMGQRYSTTDKSQDKDIQRRITAIWTAFATSCDVFINVQLYFCPPAIDRSNALRRFW